MKNCLLLLLIVLTNACNTTSRQEADGLVLSRDPDSREAGSSITPTNLPGKIRPLPPRPDFIDPDPEAPWLSPEESIKTMYLPEGYHLELVASEPMIQEPVAIAWDGNGRMYVAEMRSYMKDVDGSGQDLPISRISRLEDTDGDGKMDKSAVFIDSLVLPRMILPLDDRLLVNETYSYNIFSYRDTDGDGIADEKIQVYHNNEPDTRNLEHQKSGLVWNIDNWIYTTIPVRFRYVEGKLKADTLDRAPFGQWGLGKDDYGRLYFSLAGGEIPAWGFQQNPKYGPLELEGKYGKDFQSVWPVTGTPDVQGGAMRVRPADSTLNHFTACCGQSIFRGDRLPINLRGDYFVCEPVGRLIRRAKVRNHDGKIILENAYEKAEFLASADMNFRPVNTATGPDGCFYIVDMYHGIIQESNWTREGSYLRPRILRKGLDKNHGGGRIYRLVHEDYAPGPQPRLLDAGPAELVEVLDHPNGWWRDQAQKLLVLRGERSIVPELEQIALGRQNFLEKLFNVKQPGTLGRLHALWTLEGLHALDKNVLFEVLSDPAPQMRKAAVLICEQYLKSGDPLVLEKLRPLLSDSSAIVRIQLALSLRYGGNSPEAGMVLADLLAANTNNEVIRVSWQKYEEYRRARSLEEKIAGMSEDEKKLVRDGAVIYRQLCSTCHGGDGKGLSVGPIAGAAGEVGAGAEVSPGESSIAPPLAGESRINGDPDRLIRILLHGLTGPVDGRQYPDVMPAMAENSDKWIASVLSYIRNDMGNKAPVVKPEAVKKIREAASDRTFPWTEKELDNIMEE